MEPTTKERRSSQWLEWSALGIVLAVAAFLRFTQLDSVPPGMTHDEAAFGAEAELILSGERPVYFAIGYGHEPLYAYLVSVAFSFLGHSLIALRVTSAVCGLLVVLGTYLLGRRLFGPRVAWVGAAWMAVAFWPLSLSRQALRAITLPMLWLPAAWWFWKGLARTGYSSQAKSSPTSRESPTLDWRAGIWSFCLSGTLLGASLYTYMASRVTWIVYPLFAAYLLVLKRTRPLLKRTWPGLVSLLAIAVLVALPLFLHLNAHPESEKRVGSMMEPIRELLAGKPDRVLGHAWNALRVFSWIGDRFWGYNIPGRPVFNWLGSLCFYSGIAVALWHWRDPRYAFLLIWLGVGMLPAMVTTNEGIFLRAIVAQPAAYLLVALAIEAAGNGLQTASLGLRARGERRLPSLQRLVPIGWSVLAIALVGIEALRSYQAYFIDWPSRPEARNIYNQNLVASARYLRDQRPEDTVGVSALNPRYYHDPWIWHYVSGRSDPVRWFDGREGIIYPSRGEARYIFSALTLLDPALQPEFGPYATLLERQTLDARDENPYFEVWRWQGQAALQARLAELSTASPMWVSPEIDWARTGSRRLLAGPAHFGDTMALLAYRLNDQALEPGRTVELVTYWRALRTVEAEDDWKVFVHLLDRDSREKGNRDMLLPCPPSGWLPGDVAVLVHRFPIAGDVPPDQELYLEVGIYRSSTGRLPVLAESIAVGDRVLLNPIQLQ